MRRDLERIIWIFTCAIMIIGLVALYSASFENVRVSRKVFYDQLLCVFIGLMVMYLLSHVDYKRFFDIAYVFYGFTIFLLVIVLIGGRDALGARRWIDFGGINFQPSEVSKLSLILVLGRYFSKRRPIILLDWIGKMEVVFWELIFPFLLTAASMLLIFKQPDLGTSLLLLGIFLVMIFAGGLRLRYVFGFLAAGLCVVPFAWHFLKPYQKDRLLVFLNPNIDPLGAGYTIIQSKIAVGSGKILGKGWLAGTQNQLNFLPERHTDFIFSVIGEEWGFIGAICLIYCYFRLINCGLNIADQVKDKFGVMIAVGIVAILALQVIINIGMVIGLFPIVGITLPFVSYGRTSFLIFSVMMGLLLSLSKRRTIF